jgi:hypothetical protein
MPAAFVQTGIKRASEPYAHFNSSDVGINELGTSTVSFLSKW